MSTIGTTRLTAKSDVSSYATGLKFFTDHATNGVLRSDWADLLVALQLQLGNNMTIEQVADATARDALTVTSGQVAKRLVRLADTAAVYLPNAAGTGAGIWVQFFTLPSATTSVIGGVELATTAEGLSTTPSALLVPAVDVTRAIIAAHVNARAVRQSFRYNGVAGVAVASTETIGTKFSLHFLARPRAIGGSGSELGIAQGSVLSLLVAADAKPGIYGGTGYLYATGTATAGKWDAWTYVLSGGTGKWYKNGVLDSSQADAQTYVGSLTGFGKSSASSRVFDGNLIGPFLFNCELTAAEVAELYETGRPNASYLHTASNVSLATGASSDFSGAVLWTLDTGTTISGGKLNLADGHYAEFGDAGLGALVSGRRYRFTITVDSITAGAVSYFNGAVYVQFATGAGTYTVDFTAAGDSTGFFMAADGGNAVCDTFLFYHLGAMIAPEENAPGNGLVWNDQSGNGAHIVLPISGVEWALPSNAVSRIPATTNTSGNQQLHGTNTLNTLRANGWRIQARARARSGTPTVTLGSSVGASDYVASVALSTTWKTLTMVTDIVSSGGSSSLWASSNSTDVVEWDIAVEPLSF